MAVSVHYELGVHENCTQPEVEVFVSVENSTTCAELRDVIFTKKNSGCDSHHYGACNIIAEFQSIDGKIKCDMRCECAETLDKCGIYLLSRTARKDLSICEIAVVGDFLI